MNFEIEFHPVGDKSRAGDAITVRYGEPGNYQIIVIDGGTEETGNNIVEHIRTTYGPYATVSEVISTHPDSDHCSGLRVVLREFTVSRLWMHGLWHHAGEMLHLFEDNRWTEKGLSDAIRKEYPIVEELIDIANSKGVPIYEPFFGTRIGPFTVLSPQKPTYLHLVPQFRRTPAPNVALLKILNIWLDSGGSASFASFFKAFGEAVTSWIRERWDDEKLQEGAFTASENESSTVMYGQFGSSNVLLTADAGVNALRWACDNAESLGLSISALELIQVPHHGSRSNVTPSLLNRLLGPILPAGSSAGKVAVVSAPADDEKHPRKMVLNAFKRRGVTVSSTQGNIYRFHSGTMPVRANEVPAQGFQFFDNVEAYD